jgi:hypothetical protein
MSKIDVTNSIGLNEEVASLNTASLATYANQQSADARLESEFSPENVSAIISQVNGSQASSQDM